MAALTFTFLYDVAALTSADAASCADYTITLLSDYTRMVTMQTLFHDGGYNNMGISEAIIEGMMGGEDA